MTGKKRLDNIGEKLFQTDPKFGLFARGARQDLANLLPKKPRSSQAVNMSKVIEKPAHPVKFRLAISAMLSAVRNYFKIPPREPLADLESD